MGISILSEAIHMSGESFIQLVYVGLRESEDKYSES